MSPGKNMEALEEEEALLSRLSVLELLGAVSWVLSCLLDCLKSESTYLRLIFTFQHGNLTYCVHSSLSTRSTLTLTMKRWAGVIGSWPKSAISYSCVVFLFKDKQSWKSWDLFWKEELLLRTINNSPTNLSLFLLFQLSQSLSSRWCSMIAMLLSGPL